MTSTELNDAFAVMIDQMAELVKRFDEMRTEAADDAWDQASEDKPYADLLCEIEYELETALATA